jgi:uncharacterized protein YkwD
MKGRSRIGLLPTSLIIVFIGSLLHTPAIFAQFDESSVYLPIVFSPSPIPAPFTGPDLPPDLGYSEPGSCLTVEEASLLRQLNDYREENGLTRIQASISLTEVAQWHVIDLMVNKPNNGLDPRGYPCNSHSWSSWGNWQSVCYTSDHQYASGMWDKPKEITEEIYHSSGFEIAAWMSSGSISASTALDAWKGSPAHKAVILEEGAWKGKTWPAMGVGIYHRYAVVWFGSLSDPKGTIGECETALPH